MYQSQQQAAAAQTGFAHFGRQGRTSGRDKEVINVLCLDDSDFDRQFLARQVRQTQLPVNVTMSADLGEFRAALDERTYDLIFVDYLLTEGDGLMARDLTLRHPINGKTPAVMISNEVRDDIAAAARAQGFLDVLPKTHLGPVTIHDLILRALDTIEIHSQTWIAELLQQNRKETLDALRVILREEFRLTEIESVVQNTVADMLNHAGLMHLEQTSEELAFFSGDPDFPEWFVFKKQ